MYKCIITFKTTSSPYKQFYNGDKINSATYFKLTRLDQSNFTLINEDSANERNTVSDIIDSVVDMVTPSLFYSDDRDSDSGSSNSDSTSSSDFGGGGSDGDY